MAILGSLIKGAIHLAGTLSPGTEHGPEQQQDELTKLLTKARDTAFGKDHHFSEILNSEDIQSAFREAVPIFNYEKIFEAYWHRLLKYEPDVTWPGEIKYFALSSGTTGSESKRIPVSSEMIDSIRNTGIQQLLSLSNFDVPSEVFEKEVLMLGSSTDLMEKDQHLEGQISGIGASNIPSWFRGVYRPGTEIAAIDDWDERIAAIAKEAPNWDVGALSGIPSWIQLMLEEIIKYHKLEHIHEIWPNLTLYTTGGVAFEPYRKSFELLVEKPLIYMDTYLASEGFFAYNARPETKAMQLALDNGIYYEFVPFDEQYLDENGEVDVHAPSCTLQEIEEDKDYILLISTCAGTWRYTIGDTIKFTDVDKYEIVITGRTKFFLNVVGSQLSVDKLNQAIEDIEHTFDMPIKEYCVAAVKREGQWTHQWYLGVDDQPKNNNEEIAHHLDHFLKDLNKNYEVARGKALKAIHVSVMPMKVFHKWHEKSGGKGGQNKMPRVMKTEWVEEWENHIDQVVNA